MRAVVVVASIIGEVVVTVPEAGTTAFNGMDIGAVIVTGVAVGVERVRDRLKRPLRAGVV